MLWWMYTPIGWLLLALIFSPVIVYFYILVLRFIVLPIRLHRSHTLDIAYAQNPTRDEDLTPELREFLGQSIRQFTAEGFVVASNVCRPAPSQKAMIFQIMLTHPANGDAGAIIAVQMKLRRALKIAVRSAFGDGMKVVSRAQRELDVSPPDPSLNSENFPWVSDAQTLYEAHRRRLRKLGLENQRRVAMPSGPQLQQFLDEQRTEELNRLQTIGYYWCDAAAGLLRHTWKGAFLHTWKSVPPIRQWRTRLRDRRARKIWKSLGMDTWRPSAPPPVSHLPETAAYTTAQPQPSAAQAPSTSLNYQTALQEGEVRFDRTGDSLTVIAGLPSRWRTVARQWPRLIVSAVLIGAIFIHLAPAIAMYRIIGRRLPRVFFMEFYGIWLIILFWLVLFEVIHLVRVLRRAGQTVRIVASPGGLQFFSVLPRPRSGAMRRDDIVDLLVQRVGRGTRLRHYLIVIRARGQQILLAHRDLELVQKIRSEIAQALQIAPKPKPESSMQFVASAPQSDIPVASALTPSRAPSP